MSHDYFNDEQIKTIRKIYFNLFQKNIKIGISVKQAAELAKNKMNIEWSKF